MSKNGEHQAVTGSPGPSGDHSSSLAKASVIQMIIAVAGALLAAYLGYLGLRYQADRPIEATQTAEAKEVLIALSATVILPVPSITPSLSVTPFAQATFEPSQMTVPTAPQSKGIKPGGGGFDESIDNEPTLPLLFVGMMLIAGALIILALRRVGR